MTSTKPPLFSRLRNKIREYRSTIRVKDQKIACLERALHDQASRCQSLEQRLRNVVSGDVDHDIQQNFIRMCVRVDVKNARMFPKVWEEATIQLRDGVRRELDKLTR